MNASASQNLAPANSIPEVTVARHPNRKGHWLLQAELWVPREPAEVFPFFADASNLEMLTPPDLRFQIKTALPIDIKQGTLIDYRIRLRGIPMSWRTEIADWNPPISFADHQLRGPYRTWEHLHTFEPQHRAGVSGTLLGDHVTYRPPFGAFANWLMVEREVRRIFAFRQAKMIETFGTH